ncbi:SAM-dependent methyltransferase [Actinomadura rudentiformis]|uniref:SAM-dependent methyltransferase n=1 Tax=Actinomadura rudentiformis TaxID=359158 RepID=A0A6H9YMD0_9ACTN|nr:SAM-dependent methyltransferase [Actinomadura rudentiformis]KAB2339784.1 SAM-dependent methyltransferase [Actinomadura rudentiformis]
MTDDSPALPIDKNVPHSARIWNHWLGGKDNYLIDREVGDQIAAMFPGIVQTARQDRAFLGRAVQYLVGEAGVRQFLDIGTGLPTHDNTHQVAQRIAGEARIVYVDNDPLVLMHARALLTSTPQGACDYVHADLRDPEYILDAASGTLDFDQPIALMLLGIVHFLLDDDHAHAIVDKLVQALPSGSYLAIAHATGDVDTEDSLRSLHHWNEHGEPKMTFRTIPQIASFFDGLELVEPGVVSCSRWRAELTSQGLPPEVNQICGLARKP